MEKSTKRVVGSVFSIVLLCCSAVLAQEDLQDSLIKVQLYREFPGIVHQDQLIPQIRVEVEVAELEGAVVDPRGVVIAYVGDAWPELSLPGVAVRAAVETRDGKKYAARVMGVDERLSLVVLECRDITGPCLGFGENANPSDVRFLSFVDGDCDLISTNVVKMGAKGPLPERQLQIAALRHKSTGRSVEGGLVLDGKNQLVGIVTREHPHPFSRKIQVWGLLPADILQNSVRRIVQEEKNIKGGWLGVMLSPGEGNLRVKKVVSDSPAQKAGLRRGDVIVNVDSQPVENLDSVAKLIRWKGSGARLDLDVLRGGRLNRLSALLSHRQDSAPRISWRLEVPEIWSEHGKLSEQFKIHRTILPPHLELGLVMEPMTPQLARFFRSPQDHGLLIKSVLADSPAQEFGLKAGDVITQVNGRDVASHAHLAESLRVRENVTLIQFVRSGRVITRQLVLP